MRLLGMADWFRDQGLVVVEEPGWQQRGRDWLDNDPVGMMQHHTACCMPYPVTRLYPTGPNQFRIKCNFSIQPGPDVWTDPARVHVIAAGRANWSSGTGSGKVLNEVRQNIAPIEDARIRRLIDTRSGSRHFINNETAHPGDGSPIPGPMTDAIDLAWLALAENVPLHPNTLISHAEWTARKIDPRWRNKYGTRVRSHHIMNDMRARLAANLADPPDPPTPPPIQEDDYMLPLMYGDGYEQPPADSAYAGQDRSHRKADVQYLQLLAGSGVDAGFYGPNTASDIAAALESLGIASDGRVIAYTEWDALVAARYEPNVATETVEVVKSIGVT